MSTEMKLHDVWEIAEQGGARAQYVLGRYYSGDERVISGEYDPNEKNYGVAIEWFESAARGGHIDAFSELVALEKKIRDQAQDGDDGGVLLDKLTQAIVRVGKHQIPMILQEPLGDANEEKSKGSEDFQRATQLMKQAESLRDEAIHALQRAANQGNEDAKITLEAMEERAGKFSTYVEQLEA